MPSPRKCIRLNRCSSCCPGISQYDTFQMSFNLPTLGVSGGPWTVTNTQIGHLIEDDAGNCFPAEGYHCCHCGCAYDLYYADHCNTIPDCADRIAITSPDPGGSKLAYALFECTSGGFQATIDITNADCSSAPSYCSSGGGAAGELVGPLELATLQCACPNGFYAKFTPIYCAPTFPGATPIDASGYIEVTGTDDLSGCPFDCPEGMFSAAKSSGGVLVATRRKLHTAATFAKAVTRHVLHGLPMATTQEKERRLSICRGCEHFDAENVACRVCACGLNAKTSWALEKCPIDKW